MPPLRINLLFEQIFYTFLLFSLFFIVITILFLAAAKANLLIIYRIQQMINLQQFALVNSKGNQYNSYYFFLLLFVLVLFAFMYTYYFFVSLAILLIFIHLIAFMTKTHQLLISLYKFIILSLKFLFHFLLFKKFIFFYNLKNRKNKKNKKR